jgi:hypothetical protein
MVPSQSTLHDLGNKKKSPAKTIPLPLVPIDCNLENSTIFRSLSKKGILFKVTFHNDLF